MIESLAQYLLLIGIAVVVVVFLLSLPLAIRGSRPRYVSPVFQIIVALLPFGMAVLVMQFVGFGVAPLWAAIALVAGAAGGWFVGKSDRMNSYEGKAVVQPAGWVAWLVALSWVLAAACIVLLGANAASVAVLLVLAFAAVALLEVVMHAVRARSLA